MNLNIDYKIRPADNEVVDYPGLTVDYINYAFKSAFPDGLEHHFRRIFGRLQKKMDDALFEKRNEIELEEAEKDLMKKAFEKAKFPANLSKFVMILEEELLK